jgi:hypothetical protein
MQQPEQEQQLPEQQHPQGQEEHQLDYEPLPQRIGANKAKRRRRGEPQPQPPDEPPPPAAVAGAAAAAGACNGAAAAADVDAGAEDEQRQQGMTAYRSAAVGQHKFECELATTVSSPCAWSAKASANLIMLVCLCIPSAAAAASCPTDLDHTADVQLHACESGGHCTAGAQFVCPITASRLPPPSLQHIHLLRPTLRHHRGCQPARGV